jgi:starch-binding outer membrane protein, SusD/RagB family
MKTKYKILIIALITLFSCEDYLDKFPLDKPSDETFYSSQDEIQMAVNACYNYIAMRDQWPWVPTSLMTDAITDIQSTRSTSSNLIQIKKGELNASSSFPEHIWEHYYKGVNRTNSLLDNMFKAEDVSDNEIFKRIKAEARVIRALCYIELIQKFGDVPFITSFTDVEEALNLTRTPKSEILTFIYKELDEAAPDLPNKYTDTTDKGRITKGAALALKARVALYNNDWIVARNAAKAVIDLGVYKLYPSYRDLFTYKAEYSDEIILDFQFNEITRTHVFHWYLAPRNSQGQSQNFPTEDLIASFECTDGKIISESPLYDPTDPFSNRDPRLHGAVILPRVWDGETIKTNGTVFNNFEFMSSKEILYQADGTTVLPSSLREKEKTVLNQNTGKMVTNQEVTNAYSSFTGYCIYKYMDEDNMTRAQQNYNNIILCRYAEVLLTYVEASIEAGQIDQSVLDALNMIRARAYGNTTTSGTNINADNYPKITTFNADELRKIVRRERKVELCFEGFRFEDLKRWNLLVKALSQRTTYGRPENFSKLSATDIPVIDSDGFVTFPYAEDRYGLNNEQTKLRYFEKFGIIPESYKLFPIPLNETELNPGLAQNPGY